MARAARQRRENELPYIPFGPFQIRLPFIHYKLESVEFIQGLILGVTALAAVPYLEQYLGLPYELAWSCVIIETMLYMLHSLLGDPVVPGWITPTLPLTIVFLEGFPLGKERIQAMIALQMLVGLVFIFMGVTKLADKFVHAVPIPSRVESFLLRRLRLWQDSWERAATCINILWRSLPVLVF